MKLIFVDYFSEIELGTKVCVDMDDDQTMLFPGSGKGSER